MIKRGEITLRHLLAPIADLLADQTVTEIVTQRPQEVGFERGGKWLWREVQEFDPQRLDAIGILAGSMMSKPFDPEHPICMSVLPDGQRCTLIGRPVTHPGTMSITIRIPSQKVRTVHDPDFIQMVSRADTQRRRSAVDEELLGLYSKKDWPAFLSLAVRSHKTVAATGSTGSGKTTLLRRLMQEIAPEERVLTIEDTPEFGGLPHLRNRVAMFFGSAGITAEHCVEASLRMRPDRVAMQELRGAEAFAYVRLLAAGHPGGLTTWHADDGDAFTPLALMAKQHSAGQTLERAELDAILRRFIDIVVYCRRDGEDFTTPSIYFREAENA